MTSTKRSCLARFGALEEMDLESWVEKHFLKIYQQIFPFLFLLSARVNYLLFRKKSVCKNIVMLSCFHSLFSLHPTVTGFHWDLVQEVSTSYNLCMMLSVSLWQHFLDPLSGDCFNRQYVSLKDEGFPGYVENISTEVGQDHFHFISEFVPKSSAGSLPHVSPKPGERLCAFASEGMFFSCCPTWYL